MYLIFRDGCRYLVNELPEDNEDIHVIDEYENPIEYTMLDREMKIYNVDEIENNEIYLVITSEMDSGSMIDNYRVIICEDFGDAVLTATEEYDDLVDHALFPERVDPNLDVKNALLQNKCLDTENDSCVYIEKLTMTKVFEF